MTTTTQMSKYALTALAAMTLIMGGCTLVTHHYFAAGIFGVALLIDVLGLVFLNHPRFNRT